MRQCKRSKKYPYLDDTDMVLNCVYLKTDIQIYGLYLGQKKTKESQKLSEKLIDIILGTHK